MTVEFQIDFKSIEGQDVYVVGSCDELGNNNIDQAIALEFDAGIWKKSLQVNKKQFTYKYFVKEIWNTQIIEEWSSRRFAKKVSEDAYVYFKDSWTYPKNSEFYLKTKFFKAIGQNTLKQRPIQFDPANCLFTIVAPQLNRNEKVCILGNCKELGNWQLNKPILLNHVGDDLWQGGVFIQSSNVEYKYGIYDIQKKKFLYFEKGENRTIQLEKPHALYRLYDTNFIKPSHKRWKGSGVAIPVFSLRSNNSEGVGDFLDLIPFADFTKLSGQSVIQLLPIYDTTANHNEKDSYPYSAISVHALHPIYLRLKDLSVPISNAIEQEITEKAVALNAFETLQYEAVIAFKLKYLKRIYNARYDFIIRQKGFKNFIKNNEDWLKSYTVFSVLRDKYKTPDFNLWGEYKRISTTQLNRFFKKNHEHFKDVMFYAFIQWQLDIQFKKATAYLHRKSVALKGDLPIGIYRYSVDAWCHPELFDSEHSAGAPPDMFSIVGQNWGFPIYNWDVMKDNDFKWWKLRFKNMSKYFDAFRIDHILGFFRIWQIPNDALYGTLGYFEPALPQSFQELKNLGINLTYMRLVKPYILKEDLVNGFGQEAESIFNEYFFVMEDYILFKDKYDTQQKINVLNISKHTKTRLLALFTNVLFVQEKNNAENLHPRINLSQTSSFNHLDDYHKDILSRNYHNFYFERHEEFWKQKGLDKLPDLKRATNMLTCGEDLGMVPKVVPEVMEELGILSLQIQRMPSSPNDRFSHPNQAPYLSVVSPSTHDTSTLRQWWEEEPENSQFYYNHFLGKPGTAPKHLTPELAEAIIAQHYESPAQLSIIPLQDLFAIDNRLWVENIDSERINTPDRVENNWRYRMHLMIEDLLTCEDFMQKLYELNHEAKRI